MTTSTIFYGGPLPVYASDEYHHNHTSTTRFNESATIDDIGFGMKIAKHHQSYDSEKELPLLTKESEKCTMVILGDYNI